MKFIKKMLPKAPPSKKPAIPVQMPTSKGVNTKTAKTNVMAGKNRTKTAIKK